MFKANTLYRINYKEDDKVFFDCILRFITKEEEFFKFIIAKMFISNVEGPDVIIIDSETSYEVTWTGLVEDHPELFL